MVHNQADSSVLLEGKAYLISTRFQADNIAELGKADESIMDADYALRCQREGKSRHLSTVFTYRPEYILIGRSESLASTYNLSINQKLRYIGVTRCIISLSRAAQFMLC